MGLTGRQQRNVLRVVHLVLAAVLGVYLYSPLGDVSVVRLSLQVVVFPLFVISGVWMWQQARVRRLLSGAGRRERRRERSNDR